MVSPVFPHGKTKFIFFDLDDTLWDHQRNQEAALAFVHAELRLPLKFDEFHGIYHAANERAWAQYRRGELTSAEVRVQRFYETLRQAGVEDLALAQACDSLYRQLYPRQPHLHAGAREVLAALYPHCPLGVITNGFRESQATKLRVTALKRYFTILLCSEDIGKTKPHPEIFAHALTLAGTAAEETLFVGDDLNVDILPAQAAGWQTILYRTRHTATAAIPGKLPCIPTVSRLIDLVPLLLG